MRRAKRGAVQKERAIRQLGAELRSVLNSGWANGAALVPMPPSKAKDDPHYDDRLVRIASVMTEGTGAMVRELLLQTASTDACHESDQRRDVARLRRLLLVNEAVANPAPPRIAILDDVLTTGAHFCAAKAVLRVRFPGAHIIGLFAARRVLPNDDVDPFADLTGADE